jgi:hypothetical protein
VNPTRGQDHSGFDIVGLLRQTKRKRYLDAGELDEILWHQFESEKVVHLLEKAIWPRPYWEGSTS